MIVGNFNASLSNSLPSLPKFGPHPCDLPTPKKEGESSICVAHNWYGMEHDQFFTVTYICRSHGQIIVTEANVKEIIWFPSQLFSMSALALISKIYFQVYIPTV